MNTETEWAEVPLGDLVEFHDAKRVPLHSIDRAKRRGKYPYYGASGIVDYIDDYIFEGEYLLVSEDGENLSTRNTPIAFVASGQFWVNNHAHILKARKEEYLNKYLLWYLNSKNISSYITGAVQPKLSKAALASIPVSLPISEAERRAIVEMLSSLDDKIELLRKQNETLGSITRAVFHEWFVKQKAEDEPASGWHKASLGDIADVIDCLHSKKPERVIENTGRTLLQLENINDCGLLDTTDRYFISEDDYRLWTSRMEAGEGDCVITNVGRVGAVSRIPAGVKAALGRNMTAVRCRASFPYPFFLISYLTSALYRAEVENKKDAGTILDALNVSNISKLSIYLPDDLSFIERVEPALGSLWQKMEANTNQSQQLAKSRDALTPKLMSGQIRVRV